MTSSPAPYFAPHKLALAVVLALGGECAYAANFDVTVATDNGLGDAAGTLSKAIFDANTAGGDDTITLTTDVTMTGVMKRLINSNITLQSDSTPRTVSCGNNTYRPLFIKSGTVTLKNFTVSGCQAKGGGSWRGGGLGRGAVHLWVVLKFE